MRKYFKNATTLIILLVLTVFPSMVSINAFAQEASTEEFFICKDVYDRWPDELKTYTQELCEDKNIRYELVLAIIYNESRFDDSVTSECYSGKNYGLMQINYNSNSDNFLGNNCGIESAEDLLNPQTNILAGVTILSYYTSANFTETEADALYCYQNGEGTYFKMSKDNILNNSLVNKVLDKAEVFKKVVEEEKEAESNSTVAFLNEELKDAIAEYKGAESFFNESVSESFDYANSHLTDCRKRIDSIISQIKSLGGAIHYENLKFLIQST